MITNSSSEPWGLRIGKKYRSGETMNEYPPNILIVDDVPADALL